MKQILIATGNAGKLKEIQMGFQSLKDIEWVTLKDYPDIAEPKENGKTFMENAHIKAKYYADKTGLPTIADDSGIFLEAFPGMFGLKSKELNGVSARDGMAWMTEFLDLLQDASSRMLDATCAVVYYDPETQETIEIEKKLVGEVAEFPQAPLEKDFPLSAVLIPQGADDVIASMNKIQRLEYSDRVQAAKELSEYLSRTS